jgi:transcriptional regulator with XRE-family HTH domain
MERLGTIFANNLKEYRRKRGLTQEKLAEKVDVSTHHIGMIETSRNFPTFDLIERIAKALDIDVYKLFVAPNVTVEEVERLYQTVANDLERLVTEAVQKALSGDRGLAAGGGGASKDGREGNKLTAR